MRCDEDSLWIASKETPLLCVSDCEENLTGLSDGDGIESVLAPESELHDDALLS